MHYRRLKVDQVICSLKIITTKCHENKVVFREWEKRERDDFPVVCSHRDGPGINHLSPNPDDQKIVQ